ncbi:MAG TPA: protein translocase subunit SecD, partial [Pseudomonadales bacterium]|nr:protein translocase subunit SecD [Pseudomonadales bacterium]
MTYRNYPVWKYAAIVIVTVLSLIYAIPNLYPDDPAIQISGAGAGSVVGEPVLNQALDALTKAGIDVKGKEANEHAALIRLHDTEAQLKAKAAVQVALGEKFVVALNLAPTTPNWLLAMGAKPMRLGLDLRGGVHFVMEVDMDKALSKRFGVYLEEFKDRLREEKLRYSSVSGDYKNGIVVTFTEEKTRDDAVSALRREFSDFVVERATEGNDFLIKLKLQELKLKEIQDYAISQNLTTLRNRVNELGVAEPIVQRQ